MIEVNKRNIRMWSLLGPSGAVGAAAKELIEVNDEIVFLTADLCFFSGLDGVKKEYPDRIINMGIAEQNMIGVAAGMAKEGLLPFATTYASFCSSRCMDQVRVNMSYMSLPIKLIGLTSGFGAGILGATHMCIEDISIMRALPNMVVLSPADCLETIKCILAASKTTAPTYIRIDAPLNTPVVYKDDYDFNIGKSIVMREGKDICIMTTGAMVYESLEAAKLLEKKGISCTVVNNHTIKPLDSETIENMACNHQLMVSVEEHNVMGGLGSAISELLLKRNLNCAMEMIGIEDFFPYAGSYRYQLEQCGLSSEQIALRIENCINM